MRITVIGINYAPELTGIAPYTTGLAEGLTEQGHEVTVLSGLPHYPEWRIADGYQDAGGSTECINGVNVRRVRHYVPVVPTPRGRVRMEASFACAVTFARWGKPDVVIVVSPSLLSAGAVVALSRVRRIPVGVIVQDVYSSGVVETGALQGRAAVATAVLESAVLRSATGVAIIHDRFADAIIKFGVDRTALKVIRNWTHIDATAPVEAVADVRSRLGWASDEVVVLHSGNMGVKQGLENVVSAAKIADDERAGGDSKVRFVLLGDGNQRSALAQMSETVRSVDLLDPVPESEFRSVLNAADVLLVNERPGVGDMAIPSKLTSYFISGKPVLAATDAESGTAQEVRLSGAGLVVAPGEPAGLLKAAREIAADKVRAEEMGEMGQRFANSTLTRGSAIASYTAWCGDLLAGARRGAR